LLPDGADVPVAGESHYQNTLEELAGGTTAGGAHVAVIASLIAEPNNQFDPDAIRVEVNRKCVGYLPRAIAPSYKQVLAALATAGRPARCRAFIVGGWKRSDADQGMFGVTLELASPDDCLRAVVPSDERMRGQDA
jgi:hypothetical protein